MITVPWWVLPALLFAGGFLGTLVVAVMRARADAMFTVLAKALDDMQRAEQVPAAPEPVEVSGPWSFQHLFDGMPEQPKLPDLPKHEWFRELTGPLAILPAPGSAGAVVVAEVVEEAPPNPRKRFSEPGPPREITVTTAVADEVRSEKVQVPA